MLAEAIPFCFVILSKICSSVFAPVLRGEAWTPCASQTPPMLLLLVLPSAAPGSLSDKIQMITIIGNCIKAVTETYTVINIE